MDRDYERIERILYSIPRLKAETENLKLDIEALHDEVDEPHAIQYNTIAKGSPTYTTNSTVELQILHKDNKLQQLEAKIKENERQIKRVENILLILTPEEQQLIESKYFKRLKIKDITIQLNITEDTFLKRRRNLFTNYFIPMLLQQTNIG